MKKLTPKQQKFAELCVELGNQSEAYRQAYDVSNKDAEWIKSKASRLASEVNISETIKILKEELREDNKVTKQRILDYHIQMVEAWEELWELGKKQGKTKEETQRFYLLKEMVKGSDYRGSLDSMTKMLGLNEPEKHEHKIEKIKIEVKRNRDE